MICTVLRQGTHRAGSFAFLWVSPFLKSSRLATLLGWETAPDRRKGSKRSPGQLPLPCRLAELAGK